MDFYSEIIFVKNLYAQIPYLQFIKNQDQKAINKQFEIQNIFILENYKKNDQIQIYLDQFTQNLNIGHIHYLNKFSQKFYLFLKNLPNTTIKNIDLNLDNYQNNSDLDQPIITGVNLQNFTLRNANFLSNFSTLNINIFKFQNVNTIKIEQLSIQDTIFKQKLVDVNKSNYTLLSGFRVKNCFFNESLIEMQQTHINIIKNSIFILESNSSLFNYFSALDNLNQTSESITKNQMLALFDKKDGSKSLINIYDFQEVYAQDTAYEVILQNIQADFSGYDSRFISVQNPHFEVLVEKSSFSNMKSSQNGGCLRFQNTTAVGIGSSNFTNCKSNKFGGAISIFPKNLRQYTNITGLNIIGNSALFGGGIFVNSRSTIDEQKDVTFKNNTSSYLDNDLQVCKLSFAIKQIIEYIPNYFQQEYLIRNIPLSNNVNLTPGSIYVVAIELQFFSNPSDDEDFYTIDNLIFEGNMYDYCFLKQEKPSFEDYAQYLNYSINIQEFDQKNPYILFQPNSKLSKYYTNFQYEIEIIDNIAFSASQCIEGQQRIQFNNLDNSRYICQYCSSMSANIRNDTFECQSCDSQLFSKCYLNYTELNTGYWRQSNQISKDQIYKCQSVFHDSCIGGSGYGNQLCSEGRVGNECATCDETSSYWNSTYTASGLYSCVKCEDIQQNTLKISLGFSLFIILLLIINFNNFKKTQNFLYQQYLSQMKIIFIGTSFTKFGLASVYIKVLSFNASLLVFIQNQLEINFQNSILQTSIQYSAPLQTTFASVNCALYEFFPSSQHQGIIRLKFYLILPLVIIPLTLITPFLRYLFKLSSLRFLKYNIALSIIYTLFIVFYNLILSTILDSLTCRSFGNGERALQLDLTVPCDQASNYYIYSLIGLAVYSILVPAYLIYSLISRKHKLYATQTLFQYGFLYLERSFFRILSL
ncbi:transmembrane protein, putative (macronuclear) [Tetrahymena thermophila SB210]|uniref:Transmembrane protein, putative n=1 Tax=Tetrahymena thermophila (strain SB210) TaxID=312017 RepID=Q23JY4_TETTS|nr:transmembrane protein, putative [Tetrahymena thermophila SB210]EAR97059.2 transmembrane protein, putative [Tetrahymena thermophila SB210]|eukprot:XP_001017304.2 transmembrane protein, putative [Tetrahymena thermophila SB210]